ncbi:MAG TPA: HYR domain-containing protein, partial [Chitinophagales bacterium]|nr:HYR domain-containing protein [Chitinophagales bacterium]HRK27657.1 HYR domain-containing protein [Chitinophagales bacterium]
MKGQILKTNLRSFIACIVYWVITNQNQVMAQPGAVGTNNLNGSPFTCTALTDLGAFRQARIQATQNSSGVTWEFPETCSYPGNVWRPYASGTSAVAFNTVIPPVGGTGSALYNSSNGGSSGTLATTVSGRYYTFNIEDKTAPNNLYMAVLETAYNPISITSVARCLAVPAANQSVLISIVLSANLTSGENVFVRYTTDAYATSTIVQATFSGTLGIATIPALPESSVVSYYVYSSNRTLANINASVTSHGQVAHDMSTLNLENNGGSNYGYTVIASVGSTLYVDASVSSSGNGYSWATAFKTLDEALALAHCSAVFNTINVAAGTYKPTKKPYNSGFEITTADVRDVTFHLPNGVALYGGFPTGGGTRNITANPTILSGDFNNDDVISGTNILLSITGNTENAYHVVLSVSDAATTILDGFTVSGGNAENTGSISVEGVSIERNSGGGMYNHASSPTITNVTFTGNDAPISTQGGGGMYNISASAPAISNCIFTRNYGDNGGGIRNNNSSPTISNCSFIDNRASNGGGIAIELSSSPTISHCTFFNNGAANGAGIRSTSTALPMVTNCAFVKNRASSGGGMHTGVANISNCTFTDNEAPTSGGGMDATSATIVNNCIIWANNSGIQGTPTVNNSIVQGGYGSCTNCPNANGNVNPVFVNAADPDGADNIHRTADDGIRLLSSSPAINAGDNSLIPSGITTDIIGAARIQNTTVDLGAYEGGVCPTLTAAAPPVVVSSQSTCTGCALSGGVIAPPATACPAGSTLQYSTNGGSSWTTTLPTYNQTTPITVLTRCMCNTDNLVVSPTNSVTTVPGVCTPVTPGITNNTGTTALSCTTTSINVTATGGSTYAWSGGGTPSTAANTFTAANTYTVTITRSNGCSATSSINITFTPDTTPPTITCAGTVNINTSPGLCTGTTTLTNPTVNDNCAGSLGNALHYAGAAEVTAPITGLPTGNNVRTVEFWVKIPNNISSLHHIVSWGNFTCAIYPVSGVMRPHLWGSFNDISSTTLSVPFNTWTHVAYVLTGTQIIFYVNGVADAKTYTHNTGSTGNLYVGSYFGATGQTVDEVRIWNTARTQTQIQASMGTELIGNESGLVAYYKFNQGTANGNNAGITTLNATTGQNGTLTGFTLNGATSNWVPGLTFPLFTNNAPSTYAIGSNTVTWTATDAAGNTATCAQTVNVTDNQQPTLTCPAVVSVNTDSGVCTANNTPANPTFSDNCSVTKLTWAMTGVTTGTSAATGINYLGAQTFNKGITTVTYTATDAANNNRSCSFTVTVTDNEPPAITCAGPVTINAAPGLCTATTTLTAPTVSDNCGLSGNAIKCDGSNDYIERTALALGTSDFTIEFWVYATSLSGYPVLFAQDKAGVGAPAFRMEATSGSNTLLFAFADASHSVSYYSTATLTTGVWTHLAVVRSGNTYTTYKNGVAGGTNTASGSINQSANTFPFRIGARSNASNTAQDAFNGIFDEFRVWNVARTPAQLSAAMNFELTGTESGLVQYYKFNQGIAGGNNAGLTTATATTGVNGTLNNFALTGTASNWVAGQTITGLTVTNNAPSSFPVGTTQVTWTATDAAGKTATCTQDVTVVDNQQPSLTCPNSVSTVPNLGVCTRSYTTTNPTFSDNCSVTKLTWVMTNATTGASAATGINYVGTQTFNAGSTTVTYIASDAANNTRSCNFNVAITDNQPPTLTCPTPQTVTTTSNGT